MEIEKKYAPGELPELSSVRFLVIEQGYLTTNPVIRVRRENDEYYLTYKGAGMMAREEHNLPLTREAYETLRAKCDGNLIQKRRYLIPLEDGLTAELDVFEGAMKGLVMAEVEFDSLEQAESFVPPEWLGIEVTADPRYHNSNMIYSTYEELFGK